MPFAACSLHTIYALIISSIDWQICSVMLSSICLFMCSSWHSSLTISDTIFFIFLLTVAILSILPSFFNPSPRKRGSTITSVMLPRNLRSTIYIAMARSFHIEFKKYKYLYITKIFLLK